MLKFLCLGLMLLTPSVFATTACMDCGKPDPTTMFIFSNIISVVVLVGYLKILSLCLNKYFKTNSRMLKLSMILGTTLCTVIAYHFCLIMHPIFFLIIITIYALLMLKPLKNILDRKESDELLLKKIAIKIMLVILIMCVWIPTYIHNEMIETDKKLNQPTDF